MWLQGKVVTWSVNSDTSTNTGTSTNTATKLNICNKLCDLKARWWLVFLVRAFKYEYKSKYKYKCRYKFKYLQLIVWLDWRQGVDRDLHSWCVHPLHRSVWDETDSYNELALCQQLLRLYFPLNFTLSSVICLAIHFVLHLLHFFHNPFSLPTYTCPLLCTSEEFMRKSFKKFHHGGFIFPISYFRWLG